MIYAILISIPQTFALPAITRKPGDPPCGLTKMPPIERAKIPDMSKINSPLITQNEPSSPDTCPTLLSRPELCI